jgi:TRAP-type mannitol/chloroaromatic compound transport system substrate-binding protein
MGRMPERGPRSRNPVRLPRVGLCVAVALGLGLAVTGRAQAPESDPEEQLKRLVVMIRGKLAGTDTIGAGVIFGVGPDRLYIMSANHVVRQGQEEAQDLRVQLRWLPGEAVSARLLTNVDPELDLAVLTVANLQAISLPQLPFDRLGDAGVLKRRDPVYAVGFPNGRPWHSRVTPDFVSDVRAGRLLFESTFLAPGHSGGALVNDRWELVGMIRTDQPPDGEAVRIDGILDRLREWNYPVRLSRRPDVEARRPPDSPARPGAGSGAPPPSGLSVDSSGESRLPSSGVNVASPGAMNPTAGRNPDSGSPSKLRSKSDTGAGPTLQLKLQSAFPADSAFHQGARHLATTVEELSGGRLRFEVLPPGGFMFTAYDAVGTGSVDAAYADPIHWYGRFPWAALFSGVPFGLTHDEMQAWRYRGGGLALQQELYAAQNLVPFPAGSSGDNMAGWVRAEIRSAADLRGLRIRAAGISIQILGSVGAVVAALPAGEVVPSLEGGVIDAVAWCCPAEDVTVMGLHKLGLRYYRPSGWLAPTTFLELIVNKATYDGLPADLQSHLSQAARRTNAWMLTEMQRRNAAALEQATRVHGVTVRDLPRDVIETLRRATARVLEGHAQRDIHFRRAYEGIKKTAGASPVH